MRTWRNHLNTLKIRPSRKHLQDIIKMLVQEKKKKKIVGLLRDYTYMTKHKQLHTIQLGKKKYIKYKTLQA